VLGPRRELAVEEHRHAELLSDQRGGGEHLRDGRPAPLLVEVDDRHHVERAHVRVDAGVRADVDARDRGARAAQQRLRHVPLPRGEREHGAIVVRVGVEVEEARRRERPPDGLERGEVTPLAHVGHGHQKRRSVHEPEG
jgi:hypothetical protein